MTAMKTALLATNNAKKAKELEALASGRFVVKTLKDVGLDVDVVEDAPDFLGNAWKKADGVLAVVKERRVAVDVVIADDSGLIVDALDGRPGVRSARFAADAGYAPRGPEGPLDKDAANNRLLLTLLGALPDERRAARFRAVVVAVDVASGARVSAEGDVLGRIARDEVGGGGFGYDPLFVVVEGPHAGRRMAELSPEEKHAISHRGRAMSRLLAQL